ncbi:MAG: lipoate--protein ligase family protein [Candidatus Hodarchaeales archaeon]
MRSGRVLEYSTVNLHQNLALEQVLLHLAKETSFDATIRFWKNPQSVILGRSQQIDREVNLEYCKQNNIVIGRRISGGGTVYQDSGNLNTSILIKKELISKDVMNLHELVSFFTEFQIRILKVITKNRSFTLYNNSNILFSGLKVSGSAAYNTKNWLLYHSTMLLNTNLDHMKGALLAGSYSTKQKGDSDYFPTTNLENLDKEIWKREFVSKFQEEFGLSLSPGTLSQIEIDLSKKLAEEMYSNDIWLVDRKRNNQLLNQD